MASILNNISALTAQRNLTQTTLGMSKTLGRLSTGLRINQANDDPAGLAIANKLSADVRILNQAVRNANDGIAIIQTADKALDEVAGLLARAAELAEQAASDTSGADNSTSKTALQDEFNSIRTEIERLGNTLEFNGTVLFSGSASFNIRVGGTTGSTTITLSSSNGLGNLTTGSSGLNLDGLSMATASGASTAMGRVTSAINTISGWRGNLGAIQTRLQTTISTLGVTAENITAAISQIRDADIAAEVINLTKYQILMQSGTASLAQANVASQTVLALLR